MLDLARAIDAGMERLLAAAVALQGVRIEQIATIRSRRRQACGWPRHSDRRRGRDRLRARDPRRAAGRGGESKSRVGLYALQWTGQVRQVNRWRPHGQLPSNEKPVCAHFKFSEISTRMDGRPCYSLERVTPTSTFAVSPASSVTGTASGRKRSRMSRSVGNMTPGFGTAATR